MRIDNNLTCSSQARYFQMAVLVIKNTHLVMKMRVLIYCCDDYGPTDH